MEALLSLIRPPFGQKMTRRGLAALLLLSWLKLSQSFIVLVKQRTSSRNWKHSSRLDAKAEDAEKIVAAHPVLLKVYSAMIDYKEMYGHPNIPLGCKEGKQCETLRRLQIQGKLSAKIVDFLTDLGFRWHSLEDVYETSNFDDLYDRLIAYRNEEGGVSPPKKYPADPELGAWVTGIRRLGPNKVLPEHVTRLNAIHFEWISSRKCGSAFMEQYRNIKELIDGGELGMWTEDKKVQRWVRAQQDAFSRGALSDTRNHYMQTLLGEHWTEWKP